MKFDFRMLPKALLVLCVIALSATMYGCEKKELQPFYWDVDLTEEYIPPGNDPAGGQDPSEIEAGAQVFQNKYGSILIPADWIIGKDRAGVSVKNLANGAIFRESESDDAQMVGVKIYHNIVTDPEQFSEWFDSFYTTKKFYTPEPDQTFNGKTYRVVSFDALVGGTAYRLEYMAPNNTLVVFDVYHATPDDVDIAYIINSVIVKE
jgi:hypothetical protein